MTETSTGEVCRLVVVGPTSRVDLSVPVHVPLADLMPTLLRSLGPDLADRGLEHSGWVLQRLGEAPLDEDLTTADLDLLDGAVLHLRPRSEQIPPLDFDDLVDGVANGIRKRAGLWKPETTRVVSLTVLGFWLLVALLVPTMATDGAVGSLNALVSCVVLLAGAAAAVRLLKDRAIGRIAAAGAVAFAIEVGLLWDTGPAAGDKTGGMLLISTTLALVVAVAAMLLVVERASLGPVAIAIGLTGGGALIAVLLRSTTSLNWVQIATLLLLLAIVLRPSIPLMSFKLAGMALPQLPIEPEDLQTDIDPEPGKEVLERTAVADQYMTALHLACGAVTGVALVCMALAPKWLVFSAVVLGGLAQLLALRPMTSAWHRLALGIPATLGLAVAILSTAERLETDGRIVVLVVLLLLAIASATAAHTIPKRRLTPIWGRVGDWAQTLTIVALMPVILGVIGAFSWVRGMVG